VKWPEREADHSSAVYAVVRITWSCISTPPYVVMTLCLIKHRDDLTSLPFIEYDFVNVAQRVPVTSPLMGPNVEATVKYCASAFRVGGYTLWNAARRYVQGWPSVPNDAFWVVSACYLVSTRVSENTTLSTFRQQVPTKLLEPIYQTTWCHIPDCNAREAVVSQLFTLQTSLQESTL
jgi:hypothetical protein